MFDVFQTSRQSGDGLDFVYKYDKIILIFSILSIGDTGFFFSLMTNRSIKTPVDNVCSVGRHGDQKLFAVWETFFFFSDSTSPATILLENSIKKKKIDNKTFGFEKN